MDNLFADLVNRISDKLGYNKIQVAKIFGITRQTLSRRIREGQQDLENLLEWANTNDIDLNWLLLGKEFDHGYSGDIESDNYLIKVRKVLSADHPVSETLRLNIDSFYTTVFPRMSLEQVRESLVRFWDIRARDSTYYLALLDTDGTGFYFNRRIARDFPGLASGVNILDWVTPEHRRRMRLGIESTALHGRTAHLEVQSYTMKKDGSIDRPAWHSIFLSPLIDTNDSTVLRGIVALAAQIEEHMQAFKAVRSLFGIRKSDIIDIHENGD